LAYAGEVGVFVKPVTLEYGYHTAVFHLAVGNDGVEYLLPYLGQLFEIVGPSPPDKLGQREERPRVEPSRYVVARGVVQQRFGGYGENVFLQVFELLDAQYHLSGLGVDKLEIAESEVAHDGIAQVDRQLLGVLVEEAGVEGGGAFGVFGVGRFDDEGYERVFLPHVCAEFQSGLGIFLPLVHERYVGDDAQHVVGIFLIHGHGLFVGAGQFYFWPPAHAQHLFVLVEGLGREYLRLFQHELVEVGQYRGVEAHRVFDQHDNLHARLGVFFDVHLVFKQLDDSQQQVGISQPAEHVVDAAEVLFFESPRYLPGKGGEQHDGYVGVVVLYLLGLFVGLAVFGIGYGDDEVKPFGRQLLEGIFEVVYLGYAGRRTQVERGVFKEYLLLDAAVFFEYERIVVGGNQQHVEDAFLHEVGKRGIFEIELFDVVL